MHAVATLLLPVAVAVRHDGSNNGRCCVNDDDIGTATHDSWQYVTTALTNLLLQRLCYGSVAVCCNATVATWSLHVVLMM